ncbi:GerAB/ArcD/ProY family transporter [Ornithinibacillus bavariensis]|uniref:GerAB/ArcD/ProY family transporter n=1 Tax=Ornithinibacillus bavariensis TaxID=545502 RepID=UPI000EE91167|nr:spore gernimation protein [Ornithinibacillus sp.]
MNINVSIKPGNRIRAFYLFFIIFDIQMGVGVIGVPRFIYMEAGRDSWIAILIAYLYIALVIYVMFVILKKYENTDLFGIHADIFGTWIGKLISTIFIIHFGTSFLSILLTYTEVVQLFAYHELPNFAIAFLIMLLVLYAVFGGIRVVVGLSLLLFISTFWLYFILYDPIMRMDWHNFLPMFQTSIPELLKGAKETSYTLVGFEILMIIYPFITNKNKAKLPAFLGLTLSIFTVLLVTTISIGYFAAEGLKHIDWALLILFKSASLTFLERLDYIVVMVWLMVILPNLVFLLWAISYGVKRVYKVPEKITIWVLAIFYLTIVNFFHYDYQIGKLTDLIARYSFWLIYVYPFILLIFVLIKKRKRRQGSEEA